MSRRVYNVAQYDITRPQGSHEPIEDSEGWLVIARDARHAEALVRAEGWEPEGDEVLDARQAEWAHGDVQPLPPAKGAIHYGIWWAEDWILAGYGWIPDGYQPCAGCDRVLPEEEYADGSDECSECSPQPDACAHGADPDAACPDCRTSADERAADWQDDPDAYTADDPRGTS